MTKILCVIPARLQSTRLPRKALALIQDKPMIQWTYEAASTCQDMHKVIVATDSDEIARVIEHINGHVEMTPSDIKTGSDRVAFVAQKYPEYDVVVNLQGDEPFVTNDMLSSLVGPFLQKQNVQMTTLAAPLNYDVDYQDPDTVKVIYDHNHDALYFSRSPIPFLRDKAVKPSDLPIGMHLGLYAYTSEFLSKYTKLSQTMLECAELLEQLRVLEHGYKIRVCFTDKRVLEINTPQDLQKALDYVGKHT